MPVLVKALVEAPGISRRVSENHPKNLSVLIGHGTFDDFPDYVGNGRGFIENHHDALSGVV